MNNEFEKYKMKGLVTGLEILNGQIIDLTNNYLKLVEENDKLKNQPADERIQALNQKIFEKDKEIVYLKGKLDDCIAPQEFKEIMEWYTNHLIEAQTYDGNQVPGYHHLKWEVICAGPGIIRRAICECCGAEKDFSPEW